MSNLCQIPLLLLQSVASDDAGFQAGADLTGHPQLTPHPESPMATPECLFPMTYLNDLYYNSAYRSLRVEKVYSSGEYNFPNVFFSILHTTILTYNSKR